MLLNLQFMKMWFCSTPPNVWPHDGDIFVPVIAGLLVHKAQSVHEFMSNHSHPEAVRVVEGDRLPSTTRTKVGPTPASLLIEQLSA